MPQKKHLLVIRLSAMGDAAISVPLLRAFAAQYPDAKVTVLSKPFLQPLFADIDNIDFFAAEVTDKHKGLFGIWKLYRELNQQSISHIADLHNVLRSKLLRFFFRLSFKKVASIDKGRAEKKALTRTQNKIFKQLKSTHHRYADVFKQLGFPLDISNPKPLKKPILSEKIIAIAGDKNEKKWIGIAPFAQYESKSYPLDLMEKVIQNLSTSHHLFLFGGGKKETDILLKIAEKYPNTSCIAGQLNLSEELALMAYLDLMVAMDSGNAHLAAMQDIPTITLWGATHPYAGFAPFNQPLDNCLLPDLKKYPNLPCSVYGNKICEGYNDAMRSIPVERVTKKIETTLNQNL